MKKFYKNTLLSIGIIPIIALILFSSSPVFALTDSTKTLAANDDTKLATIKTRANAEIDKRVTSLSDLISKINSIKRLTASEKSSYISDIQTNISDLKALKIKVDADTALQAIKTDIKDIYNTFRIYAVYMPKVKLLAAVDAMSVTQTKISEELAKLNARILSDKTAGKNTATLETVYAEALAKNADALTQYTNVETTVKPLTPAGYPGNSSVLKSARSALKTASQDLHTAFNDIKTIIAGLKNFKN